MRDYYAEEIEKSAPKRDYFTEELIKNKPERTENVLQRAAKSVWNMSSPNVEVNSQFPFLPKINSIGGNMSDEMQNQTSQTLEESVHHTFLKPLISLILLLLLGHLSILI